MMTPTATVFVIDDDEAVRKSLGRLLGRCSLQMQKLGITSVAQLIGVVKKAAVPPLVRHTTKVS